MAPKVSFRADGGSRSIVRASVCWFVIGLTLGAASLAAQSSLAAGVTVGAAKLTDQRSERALSGTLQLQTTPWLSLSAVPSFVHVSDMVSGRPVSSSGIGDLPLSAAAIHAFPTASAPTIAAALTVVLPTGNAACSLGSRTTSAGGGLWIGPAPEPEVHPPAHAGDSTK